MALESDLDGYRVPASELRKRASDAPSSNDIAITDVFDDKFIREYTDFETFDEVVSASPSPATSSAELELIPDGTWDVFVAEQTVFDDEEEFVMEARDHWVKNQLSIS